MVNEIVLFIIIIYRLTKTQHGQDIFYKILILSYMMESFGTPKKSTSLSMRDLNAQRAFVFMSHMSEW
jgi:hypothetical protein